MFFNADAGGNRKNSDIVLDAFLQFAHERGGIVIDGGRVKTGKDMIAWAREAEALGVAAQLRVAVPHGAVPPAEGVDPRPCSPDRSRPPAQDPRPSPSPATRPTWRGPSGRCVRSRGRNRPGAYAPGLVGTRTSQTSVWPSPPPPAKADDGSKLKRKFETPQPGRWPDKPDPALAPLTRSHGGANNPIICWLD